MRKRHASQYANFGSLRLLYTLTLNLVHDRIIVSQMDFYID